jgi:uncharacterized membrane protein
MSSPNGPAGGDRRGRRRSLNAGGRWQRIAAMHPDRLRRRWPLALALLAIPIALLAAVVTPLWIMRPFAPQTAAGMATAHAILRLAPLLSLLAAAAAVAIAWRLWKVTRWPGRTLLAVALLVTGAAAWLTRQNIFDRPFPSIRHPGYVAPGAAASFVAPADPVLAIRVGGDAVAYPVRQLAYHHVVEDVVGGTPLVATY